MRAWTRNGHISYFETGEYLDDGKEYEMLHFFDSFLIAGCHRPLTDGHYTALSTV